MREVIQNEITYCSHMNEVLDKLIKLFTKLKKEHGSIGYAAGIITSDGPEYIQKNIHRLTAHTERIRAENNFPVFSATDIFTDTVFSNIQAASLSKNDFIDFWRAILNSMHITHLFMTPGWERSTGAQDEHETAKNLGIQIIYTTDKNQLTKRRNVNV